MSQDPNEIRCGKLDLVPESGQAAKEGFRAIVGGLLEKVFKKNPKLVTTVQPGAIDVADRVFDYVDARTRQPGAEVNRINADTEQIYAERLRREAEAQKLMQESRISEIEAEAAPDRLAAETRKINAEASLLEAQTDELKIRNYQALMDMLGPDTRALFLKLNDKYDLRIRLGEDDMKILLTGKDRTRSLIEGAEDHGQ